MTIDDLEAEALKLDTSGRARLAERLLASLEDLSDEESARLWLEEAARRNATWSSSETRPADDVFREVRARLE